MLKLFRTANSDSLSDEVLLAQHIRAGDAEALGKLYQRYMPMVYGVCLKIFKEQGRSEDAVMGIYEELNRKVKDHEISAFRGWLYVLARNYCLMELRKDKRKPVQHHAPEDMARFDDVDAAVDFELPGQKNILEQCLKQLQDAQRLAVQWFYYEDKSYKEISDLIAEEVGKVRSYIQNGRRNLKICIEKHER
jgi:RNA polymerase sigma factor (sigma-70 family)